MCVLRLEALAGLDFGGLPLGLVQRGPDNPFGDLLGWVVVFFVIIWPIIRGLLEQATKQRKEFAEKQRQAPPRAGGPSGQGRRTLEEILEGKLERVDSYDEPEVLSTEFPKTTPRHTAPRSVEAEPAAFGDRPLEEGSAPVYHFDDLQSDSNVELGGDPFDDSSMESDLVPEAKLREVPTEGELEADLGSAMEGIRRHPSPARSVQAAEVSREGLLRSDDPEVIFRSMGRPLSPWQKALILKEVLGAPLGSRPLPTLDNLPG